MTLIQEFLWCDHKTPTFHISYFFPPLPSSHRTPQNYSFTYLSSLKTLELPFSQPRCSLPTLISTGEKINFFHVPNTSHLLIILNQIYLDFLLPKNIGRKFTAVITFRRAEGSPLSLKIMYESGGLIESRKLKKNSFLELSHSWLFLPGLNIQKIQFLCKFSWFLKVGKQFRILKNPSWTSQKIFVAKFSPQAESW